MKILVVGIGRSGTTLTYRLKQANPKVKNVPMLETCVLYRHQTNSKLIKNRPYFKANNPVSCCEKINYTKRILEKPRLGSLDISIVDYCEMWLDRFKDEARIVHIIRYPLDTIMSMFAKRGRALKTFTGLPDVDKVMSVPEAVRERVLDNYFSVAPEYPAKISKLPQTITFKYEDLITNAKTIPRVFAFCNLPTKIPSSIKLRKTRVFGYKTNGFKIDRSIGHVIKVFNKICDGTKYKI